MKEMKKDQTPYFKHDCSGCEFLGNFGYHAPLSTGETTPMNVDLYVCRGGPSSILGGTIVARHANEGPEYASMPMDIIKMMIPEIEKTGKHSTYSPALIEGYKRAQSKEAA